MAIKSSLVTLAPPPSRKSIQSDNKNIPKNFTKAMFTYAMNNHPIVSAILDKLSILDSKDAFIEWLKENKKTIHNIK